MLVIFKKILATYSEGVNKEQKVYDKINEYNANPSASGRSTAQALAKSIVIEVSPDNESAVVKVTPHGSSERVNRGNRFSWGVECSACACVSWCRGNAHEKNKKSDTHWRACIPWLL